MTFTTLDIPYKDYIITTNNDGKYIGGHGLDELVNIVLPYCPPKQIQYISKFRERGADHIRVVFKDEPVLLYFKYTKTYKYEFYLRAYYVEGQTENESIEEFFCGEECLCKFLNTVAHLFNKANIK